MADKEPVAKTEAGRVLLRHWREAFHARQFHRARKGGEVEATIAQLKMHWLRYLIMEVDAAPETQNPGGPKPSRGQPLSRS